MIAASIQLHLRDQLSRILNEAVSDFELVPVGGGSVNLSYELIINKRERYFCKINSVNKYPSLLEKEKNGLLFLDSENILRVPEVILCTVKNDYQVLVLEWIEQGIRTESFWKLFGEQMAGLHYRSNNGFGFREDNYMGALPQSNQITRSWVDFFILHRLNPQVKMAVDNRYLNAGHRKHFENLYRELPDIFHPELPALLHGDLWSGNFLCDEEGRPVLIDPAVYYGHRSMDLAMTTLFGGFDPLFYEAYQHHFPLPGNYQKQWEVCNLYPLLIHLNLFGEGYLSGIIKTINRF